MHLNVRLCNALLCWAQPCVFADGRVFLAGGHQPKQGLKVGGCRESKIRILDSPQFSRRLLHEIWNNFIDEQLQGTLLLFMAQSIVAPKAVFADT